MRVIGESNTGPIVGPDLRALMAAVRRNRSKKVTNRSINNRIQNQPMLELARAAGDYPMHSPKVAPVVTSMILKTIKDMADTGHAFTPPQGRDADDKIKAMYCQMIMQEVSRNGRGGVAFTLNLSSDICQRARDKKSPFDYIRRAIARELLRALGPNRKVEFWFVMETAILSETDKQFNKIVHDRVEAGTLHSRYKKKHLRRADGKSSSGMIHHEPSALRGRPHIHGVLDISDDEWGQVKKAFRVVNGKKTSPIFKAHETKLEAINEDKGGGAGWVKYATKHISFAHLFIGHPKVMTCSGWLKQAASRLYEVDRQFVINAKTMRAYAR